MSKHKPFNRKLTVFIHIDMVELSHLKLAHAVTVSLAPKYCKRYDTLFDPEGPFAAIEFSDKTKMNKYIKSKPWNSLPGLKHLDAEKVPFYF